MFGFRMLVMIAALALLLCACSQKPGIDYAGPVAEWRDYGGDKGGLKFSPLTQINRANVNGLEIAWEHRSGDWSEGGRDVSKTVFQVTPLVVGDTLYYCTPYNRIFALDAESGRERWVFDPAIRTKKLRTFYAPNCRGVSYWADSQPGPDATCRERIFEGTMDSELIAVDNTLWSGRVADLRVNDESTRAIRAFNRKLHRDRRVDIALLPIGDGLTLALKR